MVDGQFDPQIADDVGALQRCGLEAEAVLSIDQIGGGQSIGSGGKCEQGEMGLKDEVDVYVLLLVDWI